MRKRVLLFFLLLLSVSCYAQRRNRFCTIYEPGDSFKITLPPGWAQDSIPSLIHGTHTVFCRAGQDWRGATVAIYLRIAGYDGNLSSFIDKDIFSYKKFNNDNIVKNRRAIKIDEGGKAEVREVLGDEHNNYEAIAYIKGETGVIMLILSTKSQGRYEANYERFENMVKSYTLLGNENK